MNERIQQFKHRKDRILSAPIMLNLELTSVCNVRCRHCYNYWRNESDTAVEKISIQKMERIVQMVKKDNVFHVVLTGGEPFLNFPTLEYGLKRLHESGISTSVNSNLILATPEKMKKLRKTGLDHVLTSLNSHDLKTNDYINNQKGAFDRIIRGIKTTINAGMRVSVNMIISEINKDHVYETAKLCSELGVQKIFGTRVVPPVNVIDPKKTDFRLERESALDAVNDLLRARKNFGIGVGTLISYPLCFFGDLEKYREFVGRGCPAQRGNRMVVNASGESHACTHESQSYGNIFKIGIKAAFKNMRKWHNGSYLFEGCRDCSYINVCGSGCRSAGYVYFKKMDAQDPLFKGPDNILKDYRIETPEEIIKAIEDNEEFIVPRTIRFRKEEGFHTINIRWANAYSIGDELAAFLMQKRSSRESFSLENFEKIVSNTHKRNFINLIYKEAIVPKDSTFRERIQIRLKEGCSVNPEDLPV